MSKATAYYFLAYQVLTAITLKARPIMKNEIPSSLRWYDVSASVTPKAITIPSMTMTKTGMLSSSNRLRFLVVTFFDVFRGCLLFTTA